MLEKDKTKNKTKTKIILLILTIAILLVITLGVMFKGDNSDSDTVGSDNKGTTDIVDINNTAMNSAIDKLLSGVETVGDPCIDTESHVYVNLIYDSYEIVDRYYGDHALFVKVKTTTKGINDYVMIRFQLNDEGKISDCIVYNIAD